MATKKPNPANRGKEAEKEVRKILEKFSAKWAAFDYERMYDARSAGGRFPAQVGDFSWFCGIPHNYKFGVIEVKEVEHDFRLPSKNFSQVPKCRKRQLAGGVIVVLVNHTTTGLWRMPPFQHFAENAGAPSWDLSGFPTFTLEQLEGRLNGCLL